MRDWSVVGTQDEATFFDDHISSILVAERDPLPAAEQAIGPVEVRWDRVGNNSAFIQAVGGTHDDRLFCRSLIAAQLEAHGLKEATYSFDDDAFRKTADWNDIMAKAKRLIQSGNVRILRNGIQNVVAWVKGDHGEYQPEIFRQDPNSQAITGSDCGCNWGEFQNQPRTRQWKKYQDRPCAHILAAHWLSQATPIDEDQQPQAEQPSLFNQPPAQAPAIPPDPGQGAPPAVQSPAMPGGGAQPGLPGIAPQAPQEGVQGPQGPSPRDVLPQFPMADIEQQNPASTPGLRGPTPTNPINYPAGPGGTFSSWKLAYHDYHPSWDYDVLEDQYNHPLVQQAQQIAEKQWPGTEVHPVDLAHQGVAAKYIDGTYSKPVIVFDPHAHEQAAPDEVYNTIRHELQHAHQDSHGEDYDEHEAEHGWKDPSEDDGYFDPPSWPKGDMSEYTRFNDNPPGWPTSSWKLADGEAVHQNGDLVQLRSPDTGTLVGRSEAHGAGEPTSLVPGQVGEVLGTHPSTGMVNVLYMGKPWDQNGPMEPYGATGWHFPSQLVARPDLRKPGPAIRRSR